MHLHPGHILDAPLALRTLRDTVVSVPAAGARLTHLQFRRFAGCPICNLHLRRLAQRHGELQHAGIHEIAVFHSDAETMRPFHTDLPFDVVADPTRELYRAFGVETSLRSVADPRAWGALLRGMTASHPKGAMTGEGGHLGLPADFLFDERGRIAASKYGEHADDQWSVDELLTLASD
jgi:hypothetical protein